MESGFMAQNKDNGDRQPLPPYVPFKTFLSFIKKLKDTTVPERIDSSVLRSYSGGIAGQLTAALKYLHLIADDGRADDTLRAIVEEYETNEWPDALKNLVVTDGYDDLLGGLNIQNATRAQLEEKFRTAGAEGEVLKKCVAFYIGAALHSGIKLSPYILEKRKRGRPKSMSNRERSSTKRESDDGTPVAGTVKFAFPIPGKPAATIFVPADLSTDDWAMIDSMIRAYIQRTEKKGS
jgi:hypothetical protein